MADYQKTMKLLAKGHVSYSQIENDLGITKDQLTRLANFKVIHPKENMIECLHNYLLDEEKHRLRRIRKCKK